MDKFSHPPGQETNAFDGEGIRIHVLRVIVKDYEYIITMAHGFVRQIEGAQVWLVLVWLQAGRTFNDPK